MSTDRTGELCRRAGFSREIRRVRERRGGLPAHSGVASWSRPMFWSWIDPVSRLCSPIVNRIAILIGRAIFASAWFQQKYGYRRLLQIGLVAMFCFIFIVFFAQNIVCRAFL